MPREDRATWKSNYFLKIIQLLDDYPKCFIVGADNVGSKQMQQIHMSLRGKAVVLMGKNTMMRKAIRGHLENNPALEKLLPHIRGNVGFVFTKEDLTEIRDMLLANKVPAAARAGAIAPCEVTVPAQNTGLGPEKTSFFQALGITTKISRGTIEILSDVQLIKTGDKVGASEATLLNMLNISPFSFGLVIQQVFDNGSIYNPEVLDITEETLHSRFLEGVRNVASVCLQIGYPTVASVPHSIINGYKRVLALSVETDYTFPLAEKVKGSHQDHMWMTILTTSPSLQVKAFLADPSAFVAAAPVAAATTAAPAAAAAAPAKVEAKEESEESDEDMGFGLFD
uniref:Large ribosomal subunit protein uL10 n=1 Tax=Cercocebus atys TaxID=9531 RepID=A0A2K5M039_CERAT